MTTPARFGLLLLAIVITYITYYADGNQPHKFRRFVVTGAVSLIALFCYLVCYSQFVRKIDVPATASTISVSTGYERSAFAKQIFGSDTDVSMLKARGTDDEEISKLWTLRSLTIVRLCLFGSFCAFILPLVWIFSLGVRYQL
jgi:hypothetical protein